MDRDHAEPPAGAAEVLRVRVDADRVVRQLAEQGPEAADECPVHVVGQQHQVGALGLDQIGDLADRLLAERHARRIGRVHDEERLDRRVLELLELGIRELEQVLALRLDVDHVERVVFQVGHLDVGREDRRGERDGVALLEEAIQRLEEIAHRRGAALDRVEIELALRVRVPAHRPHQVLMGDALVVHEHAVGHRIVVADDRIDQLVHEGVGLEPEQLHRERHHRRQELSARRLLVLGEVRRQPVGDALSRGHAAEAGRMLHHPLALGDRELAEQKEALARGGGDPIGVAAPGVEERRLRGAGRLLRELDQLVLDLERAQGLELLQGHEVTHGNRLRRLVASVLSIRRRAASRALAAVNAVPIVSIVSSSSRWVLRHESSMTTIIPQTVRSVFPTA